MMTLKSVIARLEVCDSKARVTFDFCGCVPTTVSSWRGSYDQPALGWEDGRHIVDRKYTVDELLKELKSSIGRLIYGYKGGEYRIDENSVLHIDNHGEYTSTEISHITSGDGWVMIHTVND